jgi:hypothetical protein
VAPRQVVLVGFDGRIGRPDYGDKDDRDAGYLAELPQDLPAGLVEQQGENDIWRVRTNPPESFAIGNRPGMVVDERHADKLRYAING